MLLILTFTQKKKKWNCLHFWCSLALSPLCHNTQPSCDVSYGDTKNSGTSVDETSSHFKKKLVLFVFWFTDHNYLLTPWSRVFLGKLTGSQIIKKFPTFYGTRKFITAFTSARHLFLSWASSVQSIPPHPTFLRSTLIPSSHLYLGLPSCLFPSDFSTKPFYTPLLSPIWVTRPAHLILLYLITRKILGEKYRSLETSLCSFLHSPLTSSLFGPNIIRIKKINVMRGSYWNLPQPNFLK